MLGLNELAKDVGKGLILRVARGDDDIFNSGWCRRGHVLGRGSGDVVFRDVKMSYMYF